MLRYFDHWENFAKRYESNLTDYLELNDLTIKGGFTFFLPGGTANAVAGKNSLYRFRGRRIFNSDKDTGKLFSFGDYSLEVIMSPLSNLVLTQLESGAIISEGEFNLWQEGGKDNNDHSVSIYKKCNLSETGLITSTCQLLYNYRNNCLINMGVRDYEIYNLKNIKTTGVDLKTLSGPRGVFSIGAIARMNAQANFTTWGGAHLNIRPKALQNISLLFGLSNPQINGVIHFQLERRDNYIGEKSTKIEEVGKIVTTVTTLAAEPYYYENIAKLGIEAKIANNFSCFTTLSASKGEGVNTQLVLGGLYTFDPTTNIRFKFSDDFSTTVSLTKRFRDLLDFSFVANFGYMKPISIENKLGHIKSKFGIGINLLDETLV